jgi:hypothetical protein
MRRRIHGARGACAGLSLGLALAALAGCGAAEARSVWTSWSTLQLKARAGILFSGRVEMRLDERSGQRVLETYSTARFLGAAVARSTTRSVIDSRTGRTLSHVSYNKKRGKRYLFGEKGYSVERLDPQGKPNRPLDEWQVKWRKEHLYPETPGEGPAMVYDYYGMLLHLRESDLNEPGDEITLYIATPQGPASYKIFVGESRTVERSYTDLESGEKQTLSAKEVRLRVRPADPAAEAEGFLAMEGETELWVEAETKTLLHVSGKVPKVPGRVKLTLTAMG